MSSSTQQLLQPGQVLHTRQKDQDCIVSQLIGRGGQGEVYLCTLGTQEYALKWYFPSSASLEQLLLLDELIKSGSPSPHFLWPMEIAAARYIPGFGYLMPLRPNNYHSITDLMKRRVEPGFQVLLSAGMELSNNLLLLHSKGLCYRDISFGNIFFDPITGRILICDNDNISVDGKKITGVLGTPRFMAPEVVTGRSSPGIHSDLYSLSVLLFYMLFLGHPLEGKREVQIHCMDAAAMDRLYGWDPLFIFDPSSEENRPIPGIHDNPLVFWNIYPALLKNLFTRAFTDGICDPLNGRVRESEWRHSLSRVKDWIIHCPACGAETFYDPDMYKATRTINPCWNCAGEMSPPWRMRIGSNVIILNPDTSLFEHHLVPGKQYSYTQPLARFSIHGLNNSSLQITNHSQAAWTIASSEGSLQSLEPGKCLVLNSGDRILFGSVEGEVRR